MRRTLHGSRWASQMCGEEGGDGRVGGVSWMGGGLETRRGFLRERFSALRRLPHPHLPHS